MAMTENLRTEPGREDLDLRALVAILRRQSRVILSSSLIVTLGAALFLALSTPIYEATALVLVDPSSGDLLDSDKAVASGSGPENARVDTEVEILRSDAVALAVIDRLQLGIDPEFVPGPGPLSMFAEFAGSANAAAPAARRLSEAGLVAALKKKTTIRRRGLTYLISVSAASSDPMRAAELANVLSDTYIAARLDSRIAAKLSGRDALAARIDDARARVADLERQFDAFLTTQMRVGDAAAGDLMSEVRNYHARADAGRALIRDARGLAGSGDWQMLAELLDDPELGLLANERGKLLPDADRPVQPSPDFAGVDAALAATADTRLDEIDAQARALDQKASALRAGLKSRLPVETLSPEQLAELYGLQQDAQVARAQYQQLLSRMRELETGATVEVAPSRIVSPAVAPARPRFPDPSLVGLATLALAVGLGVSLALVNEYLVGGVTSEQQLAELLRAPASAEIPTVDIASAGIATPADRIIDAPLSPYSESIRKLRAGIDQSLRAGPVRASAEPGHVILVTSPLPGEGKSTIALALARTYAAAGRKTLLIDADLRNPSIHRQLGFEPEIGFQDYLRDPSNPSALRSFYARDPSGSLALILGSAASMDATDQLLCSDTFQNILTQARDVYDITVLDSPPILPVVDPRYLASYADLAVMAVKWGATAQSDIRGAAQQLRKALAPDAILLPVVSHSRSVRAQTGYGGYYSQERRRRF